MHPYECAYCHRWYEGAAYRPHDHTYGPDGELRSQAADREHGRDIFGRNLCTCPMFCTSEHRDAYESEGSR